MRQSLQCCMPEAARATLAAMVFLLGIAGPALAQQSPSVPGPSSPPPAPPPTGASLNAQIAKLGWLHGPVSVPIGDNSTFNLPSGYAILTPPDSLKFLQLNGNPTDPSDQDYILAPEDPNASWFADLTYEDNGHIADDQKIDADQVLQQAKDASAQENTARQQQGMAVLNLTGWASLPVYDQQTHRLEWAFDYVDGNGNKSEDFNTRILSRTGDLHVILVDDPSILQSDIPSFNTALAGFSFNSGQRYSDYQTGDKLAQYGIAGLIAGGAAAVAVKTGLFAAVLGILIAGGKATIAGVVALLAVASRGMRRLLRRK